MVANRGPNWGIGPPTSHSAHPAMAYHPAAWHRDMGRHMCAYKGGGYPKGVPTPQKPPYPAYVQLTADWRWGKEHEGITRTPEYFVPEGQRAGGRGSAA